MTSKTDETRKHSELKKAAAVGPRRVVRVALRSSSDTPDEACARTLTQPEVQAAATMQTWEGRNYEVNTLARELAAQVATVNTGDLTRAEGMLIAQAHTLDALFNSLARRAHLNMGEYLTAAETYLRLALKAQSQCRATLETLAAIRNPPIVFAKQANIANGPQQVNNGTSTQGGVSRMRETENLQTKQSGAANELLPDTGASALAGRVDPQMEAVGEIDRAEVGEG